MASHVSGFAAGLGMGTGMRRCRLLLGLLLLVLLAVGGVTVVRSCTPDCGVNGKNPDLIQAGWTVQRVDAFLGEATYSTASRADGEFLCYWAAEPGAFTYGSTEAERLERRFTFRHVAMRNPWQIGCVGGWGYEEEPAGR